MKIMAVDFGDARTGIAACDKFELMAVPICVIEEKVFEKTIKKINEKVIENEIEEVVIGYPKNMDGTIGDRAKKSELIVTELKKYIPNIPIILWDERNTTKSAHRYLSKTRTRRQKRKKVVDALAATIILESYMTFKKGKDNQKDPDENIKY